jgi:hypothetical protein
MVTWVDEVSEWASINENIRGAAILAVSLASSCPAASEDDPSREKQANNSY